MINIYYNVYLDVSLSKLTNDISHLSAIEYEAKEEGLQTHYDLVAENAELRVTCTCAEQVVEFVGGCDDITPASFEVENSVQYEILKAVYPKIDVEYV